MTELTESIEKPVIRLVKLVIDSPVTYLALVVGAIVGGVLGGIAGVLSGALYGHATIDCTECLPHLLGFKIFFIEQNMTGGTLLGVIIGALLGGLVISLLTLFLCLKKHTLPATLGADNIRDVIVIVLWTALELSIGIVLGAVIGSLQLPGLGSLVGALLGLILIGLSKFFDQVELSEKK